MQLIERAKSIMLSPHAEWQAVAAHPSSTGELYSGYIAPLAAIGPIATFIGLTVIGVSIPFVGTYRLPITSGLVQAVVSFVLALVGVFVMALIVNALAPRFEGEKNHVNALNLAAYAYTPALVAGVVLILPALAMLQALAAFYALYLFYTGLPVLMKSPKEKTLPYIAVVIACAIGVGIVLGTLSVALRISPLGSVASGGGDFQPTESAASAVGALGVLAEAGKRAEAASASAGTADPSSTSDPEAVAAESAAKVAAAFVGGGKSVKTIDYHALQTLLPAAPAGMSRSDTRSERTAVGGIAVAKATADYAGPQSAALEVEISDMGNASGLMTIGTMAMSVGESESDSGFEKNVTIGGQRVHEKYTAAGKHSELSAIVDDRFLIEVNARHVDADAATKTFAAIDLEKLRALATVH